MPLGKRAEGGDRRYAGQELADFHAELYARIRHFDRKLNRDLIADSGRNPAGRCADRVDPGQ